ncbi:IclR family transcriptional regulator [Kibdelosporangium persicum]|uniref:DNA-binding transcriptional regulator, IclR family n=1 Tax=Kibdelosporangium persicum TaxID=2698649 RepID=A0ABX2EZA2_9PSEU|nr:IclR family transcriptional regulator [Kibdelosporangium persicum]NRN64037.1 DNA-binding transcriptional regulator, IclR family [Kibdelosporangium persicum]
MRAGGESGSTIQSVDRALTVLRLLARHGELGVTEIAAKLKVHKSTAFRLVTTLELHDLVEQHSERGKYRLGVGVLQLAGATTAKLDLVQRAKPVSQRLAEVVGETVNITVLSGHEALYVDQVAGSAALQLHNWVGQRIPLHATSNGKVLLASLSEVRFDELTSGTLKRFTDKTITDRAELRAQVDEVRQRGYAVAIDELEIGLTAIAAPISSADGTVVGSISASGPGFRITPDHVPDVAARVVAAGREVSRRLGWHGH